MAGKRGPIQERLTQRIIAQAYGVHINTVANWLKAGKLKGLLLKDILEFDRTTKARDK